MTDVSDQSRTCRNHIAIEYTRRGTNHQMTIGWSRPRLLHPLQQEDMPGLSGLYCLWKYLRARERLGLSDKNEIEQKLFRMLIKAASNLGLTAANMRNGGFKQRAIKAVFAQIASSAQLTYTIAEIQPASIFLRVPNVLSLAHVVSQMRGALVVDVGVADNAYWNLVVADQAGNLIVYDSKARRQEQPRAFDGRYFAEREAALAGGLVILPLDNAVDMRWPTA